VVADPRQEDGDPFDALVSDAPALGRRPGKGGRRSPKKDKKKDKMSKKK
jgi:hypothetical protein